MAAYSCHVVTTSDERPWSALPRRLGDVLRPGPAGARRRDHRRDRRGRARVRPPAARRLRPRHPDRRRAGARAVRRPARRARGRRRAAASTARWAAASTARAARSTRCRPPTGPARAWRGAAAARPPRAPGIGADDQRRLAEAIFAYIDQLAAESVAGYAVGAGARRRRGRAPPPAAGRRAGRGPAGRPRSRRRPQDAGWPLPRLLAVVAADDAERIAARLGPGAIAADDVLVVADPEAPGVAAASGPRAARPPASARRSSPREAPLSHRLAVGGPRARRRAAPVVRRRPPARPADRGRRGSSPRGWPTARSLRSPATARGGSPRRCAHGSTPRATTRRSRPSCISTLRPCATGWPDCASDSATFWTTPTGRLALQLALRARACISGRPRMAFEAPNFDLTEEELDERTRRDRVAGEIHVTTAPEFTERLNDGDRRRQDRASCSTSPASSSSTRPGL